MKKGEWKTLEYQIPALEGGLLEEVGICFHVDGAHMGEIDFVGMIDDLYAEARRTILLNLPGSRKKYGPGCIGRSASLQS